MYNISLLSNTDFKYLQIESIQYEIYIPDSIKSHFINYVEYEAHSAEECLDRINKLLDSTYNQVSEIYVSTINVMTASNEIKPTGIFTDNLIQIPLTWMDSGTTHIAKTCVDDEDWNVYSKTSQIFGFDLDEIIISYIKHNLFGTFDSGLILTNKRLIQIGNNSFCINIEDIKSISKKGFFGKLMINNSYHLPVGTDHPIYMIIESILAFSYIPFTMILKKEGSWLSTPSINLLISRYQDLPPKI